MGANTTNTDNRIYRELCQLTKNKTAWNEKIPYVASLLENSTPKIVAKAMWMLGEMGLLNPQAIAVYTANIAQFITSENDLLRERAVNALGRIGRADYKLVCGIAVLRRPSAKETILMTAIGLAAALLMHLIVPFQFG